MDRGATAEINLSAIVHNFKIVRHIAQDKKVIAVVKADAYGHGSREVSKRLVKEGASYLAVAYTGEGIELRNAGIRVPIIVLFDCKDIGDFFEYHLIPVIHDMHTALTLSRRATERGTAIKIHIKIDTGMGRLGLHGNRIIEDIFTISDMEGLDIVGLLTHFSDADLSDSSFAFLQLEKFKEIQRAVSQKLKREILSHVANSAAVLAFGDALLDAVRPGLMLYGYSPVNPYDSSASGIQHSAKDSDLRPQNLKLKLMPAMKVKTKILCVRDVPPDSPISYGRTFITKRHSRIGVLPFGYADGYNRLFSNNAEVLVKGKRVPVIGKVCMDLTMVDLTDVKDAQGGDEVVILGGQGEESITAYELAGKANTIPYEILTSLGSHSKKEYIKGETQ